MSSAKFIANVEELNEYNKTKLIEKLTSQTLSQFAGNSISNSPNNSRIMIEWIVDSLMKNTSLLGMSYWNLIEYQKGKWFDLAVEYWYGIKKFFKNIILSEEEFNDLVKISIITKFSENNFFKLSSLIQENKTKLVGFYSIRGLFLYTFYGASIELIEAVCFYNKLYRPMEITFLVNVPNDGKKYYYNRDGRYHYITGTCGFFNEENGQQKAVYRLKASDYVKLR
jgi:hypothetical protein